jgi:uncharacterized protein (DUF4415 family)
MPISKRRLKEIAAIPDSDIDLSDIPELGEAFWKHAKLEMPRPKKAISLRVDQEVLDWFKKSGRGYQSRMNAVLRSYVQSLSK